MSTRNHVDALAHFEDWLTSRGQADRASERLSRRAAAPYRYVWGAWVKWLTSARFTPDGAPKPPHADVWTAATSAHVAKYLDQGIETSASARRGKSAPVSEITQRRYWRVLQQIYQHAVNKGIIERNPVMAGPDVQPPPQEESEGLVLLGRQWQAVALAVPRGSSRWDVRDRAILNLIMDTGLTTGEIAALRLHQVGHHLRNVTLKMDGKRAAQERTLVLGTGAGIEMRHWVELRRSMKVLPSTDPGLVFVTNRGGPMSGRTLFGLVSSTISKGLRDGGFALPQHIGPHVLRNSRIVMWINEGMPVDEACRRAGFKDMRSLRGLRRHIDPEALPPPRPFISTKTTADLT